MDATKDSTGEPTSRNHIYSAEEFEYLNIVQVLFWFIGL